MKNYPLFKVPQIKTIRELCEYAIVEYADKQAYSYFLGEKLIKHTFKEAMGEVRYLATALLEKGYTDGTKIAVVGKNSYLWCITYLAVLASGNVIVPLDKDLDEKTMKKLLTNSDSKAIIYDYEYEDMFGSYDKLETISMKGELGRIIAHGEDVYKKSSELYKKVDIDSEATAAIIYTSGTTGEPKGVCLSNRSIVMNVVHANELVDLKGGTVLILPLHHTYAILGSFLSPILKGINCHINSSLKNVLPDIQAGKPYYICVVPLYIESFNKSIWANAKKSGKEGILKNLIKASNQMRRAKIDLRRRLFASVLKAFGGNLELLVCGGAPMQEAMYEAFDNFGISVIEGYGITECSPLVSVNRVKYFRKRSVGLVCKDNEVRIFDMDDNGEGEICVRGDIVMNGYYKNKKATDEVLKDGWFSTGDIGYIDDDGFLFITGRKKNLIITSTGKNIHPEELEELILTNIKGVLEVVITGDDKKIYAEIYKDPDLKSLTEKQIEDAIDEFNKTLPVYKRVNKVKFRDTEFTKTTTKKIKREYK